MKKNDFILISVILIVVIALVVYLNITKKEGSKVRVMVGNEEYKTFDLLEDINYTIEIADGEYNTFEIKGGYVKMLDASCPDKLCVHHKKIHYNNEDIVCLPNKVIIKIIDAEESDIDAVVH